MALTWPRIDFFGHFSALNWTRVQGLLMWALSMNSPPGSRVIAALVLAWWGFWVKTALTAGLPVRLVWPLKKSFSFGL